MFFSVTFLTADDLTMNLYHKALLCWNFQRDFDLSKIDSWIGTFTLNYYCTKKKLFKALSHQAIFLATCLAILLRHKFHEPLPSVTCPEINMSCNFVVATIVARSTCRFYFVQR